MNHHYQTCRCRLCDVLNQRGDILVHLNLYEPFVRPIILQISNQKPVQAFNINAIDSNIGILAAIRLNYLIFQCPNLRRTASALMFALGGFLLIANLTRDRLFVSEQRLLRIHTYRAFNRNSPARHQAVS